MIANWQFSSCTFVSNIADPCRLGGFGVCGVVSLSVSVLLALAYTVSVGSQCIAPLPHAFGRAPPNSRMRAGRAVTRGPPGVAVCTVHRPPSTVDPGRGAGALFFVTAAVWCAPYCGAVGLFNKLLSQTFETFTTHAAKRATSVLPPTFSAWRGAR